MDEEKILIVEDDLSISDLYRTELTHRGYKVLTANTGGEGLIIAKKEKPRLILVDIMLPVTDGFSFIRELRDIPTIAQTPVIIMTNLGASEYFLAEGKDLGVSQYLIKYKTSIKDVARIVSEALKEKGPDG
jgi:two-component system alkaline phosphatase synthesis response regulator PhoP